KPTPPAGLTPPPPPPPNGSSTPPARPGSGNGGADTPPQLVDPQKNQQPPAGNPGQKPVVITAVGNKIIVTSEDPAALAYAQELIRLLTQPGSDGDFEVIRLKKANATDAARVIDELFNGKQQQGQGQGQQNPFARQMNPFMMQQMGRQGGGANQRPTDANGITRPNPLSVAVDDRSNMLWVLSSDNLFKDIEKLSMEIEKQAAGAVSTIKIVPLKGIDPQLVQDAIDAISG